MHKRGLALSVDLIISQTFARITKRLVFAALEVRRHTSSSSQVETLFRTDTCKFLHDRGDYKGGWQIEKEYNEKQMTQRQRIIQGKSTYDIQA